VCRPGPRASPEALASPVSQLVPIRVSGPVRVKNRAGPGPTSAGAAGVVDAEGRDRIVGRGTREVEVVVLRAPVAALVLARLAAVIPPGS
jgi:hypothetical protein